jgi:hypothetical protein
MNYASLPQSHQHIAALALNVRVRKEVKIFWTKPSDDTKVLVQNGISSKPAPAMLSVLACGSMDSMKRTTFTMLLKISMLSW